MMGMVTTSHGKPAGARHALPIGFGVRSGTKVDGVSQVRPGEARGGFKTEERGGEAPGEASPQRRAAREI